MNKGISLVMQVHLLFYVLLFVLLDKVFRIETENDKGGKYQPT